MLYFYKVIMRDMKLKQFKKSELIKEIKSQYGSVSNLKKYLKKTAKYQYGCNTNEIKIYGCSIVYTSNPNCFAEYLISIPLVGMRDQLGLDKSSITKAGHQRGCSGYYLK
jgi:hypothetical protein